MSTKLLRGDPFRPLLTATRDAGLVVVFWAVLLCWWQWAFVALVSALGLLIGAWAMLFLMVLLFPASDDESTTDNRPSDEGVST